MHDEGKPGVDKPRRGLVLDRHHPTQGLPDRDQKVGTGRGVGQHVLVAVVIGEEIGAAVAGGASPQAERAGSCRKAAGPRAGQPLSPGASPGLGAFAVQLMPPA